MSVERMGLCHMELTSERLFLALDQGFVWMKNNSYPEPSQNRRPESHGHQGIGHNLKLIGYVEGLNPSLSERMSTLI